MIKTKIMFAIKNENDIDNVWELLELACNESYNVVIKFINLNKNLYNYLKEILCNLTEIKIGMDSGYGEVTDDLKYEIKMIEDFNEKRKSYHVKCVKIKD